MTRHSNFTDDRVNEPPVADGLRRGDFPTLQMEVNGHPYVYLDSAATSQMPLAVIDRMHRYHLKEHSNVHRGVHSLSQNATDAYESTRDAVRRLIGAEHREEILFTSGTTDSINLVAHSWGGLLEPGDRILVTDMEHHANLVPWHLLGKRSGVRVDSIPMDGRGELDLEAYERLLATGGVRLVSVVHVSNTLGTVNPVERITELAHAAGARVLIDAAQSAPHMALDVKKIGCDFLAFSAHKLCGPTGFGILYARKELLDAMPPFRGGGSMIEQVTPTSSTYLDAPFRFEPGTPPIAAGVGFGEAVRYLESIGFEAIQHAENALLEYAVDRLRELPGLRILGEPETRAAAVSFVLDGIHAMDAGMFLDRRGIAVRTGHHCTQPILRHFDVPSAIRASFMFYNNRSDVDRLADALRQTIRFFG